MSSKAGFCQHDAGVLIDGKLSPGAEDKCIKDVKDYLVTGKANLPINCGPKFPPVPFADRILLEDKTLYPEWHKNVLGTYEKIAKSLDFKGQFTILPICDPLALAVALNITPPKLKFPDEIALYGVALPLLAFKLGFELPVDLLAKFPDLLKIPPGIDLNLELPPDFDVNVFYDLANFAIPYPKFPKLLLGLMPKMPDLFLKFLGFDFSAPCDAALESKLFGDYDPNKAIVWAASQAVLASKAAECLSIALVGSTVGSASAGITGAMGQHYGYIPPPMETSEAGNVRDRIVGIANRMSGKSWGKDHIELQEVGNYIDAKLEYTQFVLPNIMYPPYPEGSVPLVKFATIKNIQKAHEMAKKASSCGLFVRGVYYTAGATHAFFRQKYKPGSALAGLVHVCDIHQASIKFDWQNIPALKRGDAILVQRPNEPGSEHVLVLTKDFAGGKDNLAEGVEGGRSDPDNPNTKLGTAIESATYAFSTDNGKVMAGRTGDNSELRQILRIMNGERMVLGAPKNNTE